MARKTSTKRVISSSGVHPAADRDHVGVVVLAGQRPRSPPTRPARARTPRTLLAAICSPLPEPPMTTPRLPAAVGDHALGGPQAEHRVVVEGVVDERPVVDGLVAVLGQPGDEVVLELETGVVGAEVHAHAGHCSTPARPCPAPCPGSVDRPWCADWSKSAGIWSESMRIVTNRQRRRRHRNPGPSGERPSDQTLQPDPETMSIGGPHLGGTDQAIPVVWRHQTPAHQHLLIGRQLSDGDRPHLTGVFARELGVHPGVARPSSPTSSHSMSGNSRPARAGCLACAPGRCGTSRSWWGPSRSGGAARRGTRGG